MSINTAVHTCIVQWLYEDCVRRNCFIILTKIDIAMVPIKDFIN